MDGEVPLLAALTVWTLQEEAAHSAHTLHTQGRFVRFVFLLFFLFNSIKLFI